MIFYTFVYKIKGMKKKICFIFVLFVLVSVIFAASRTVYVTKTGKKYHSEGCRTLSRSKNLIQLDVEEAKRRGYTACEVCGG